MGRVTIFSLPTCPHCKKAKSLLTDYGVEFYDISLGSYPEKRPDMLKLTDRLTVPQIFFDDNHIGGAADLDVLHTSVNARGAHCTHRRRRATSCGPPPPLAAIAVAAAALRAQPRCSVPAFSASSTGTHVFASGHACAPLNPGAHSATPPLVRAPALKL